MADYIDRQRLIDDFHTVGSAFVYGDYIPTIVSRIKIQPTVDLKTLLIGRCKDCANRHSSEFCECRPDEAYCSDFELKGKCDGDN